MECVEVSALTGAGIDDLLGLLVLQSEVLELQANPKANCRASIIEARVEPGTGSSATAIVESGTIRVGMPFICGPYAGKGARPGQRPRRTRQKGRARHARGNHRLL